MFSEDSFGARALNWVVIAGAAVLLLAATIAPVSKHAVHAFTGTVETVVVTAHTNHA